MAKRLKLYRKEAIRKLDHFDSIASKWNNNIFDSEKFVKLMSPLPWDKEGTKSFKREALLKVRPMLTSENYKQWIKENNLKISEAISVMGQMAFNEIEDKKEIKVDNYDVFIFDADKTIWDSDCAGSTELPYAREGDTVYDVNGESITLRDGIREILVTLKELGKRIGLISKSEKEGVDYQDQPVVQILKEFGILGLFNEMVVIDGKMPKSAFIPKDGKVIFIDDKIDNLEDVEENTSADVADINIAEFREEDILDFNEDLEPLEVIELMDGETIEDLEGWAEEEDVLIPIDQNTIVRARIKKSSKKDGINYKQFPKDCGSTSGSISEYFEIEKQDVMESSKKDWYKSAKRDYIPVSERPEKPKDGKEYELDHKKPKHKGGSDKKENLQWVEKGKHKEKSKQEGSYQDGGDKKVNQEKAKGKKNYHDYQKGCGEAKQAKDRKELGEKAYSKQQSEIAKKRWNKKK